ncbi:MAG: relaxase/mobilization nuclease domain protein [Gemmatimonadetes bacterium]|nr:relaxase/mobilization nuclease domain protein [Gemmatimonadota bacterium]
MIGNINNATGGLGKGFKGLLSYLEIGKDGKQLDRVDWVESRNLGTDRLDLGGRFMAATARESVRTEKPVFHFSVSFDPSDPVDRAVMRKVADGVLRDLKLDQHQVLIVAHKDRAHPHMHVVVNRVHPEQGRAWKPSHTKRRIEASLRRLEVEHGLRVVPGRLAPVPENARGVAAVRPAAAPRPSHGDAAFLADVKDRARAVFQRATSWGELESGLAEAGLRVRMNGRGMSVTDGQREVKASEIDRAFSRNAIEKRFGAYSSYRARVAVAVEQPSPSRDAAAVAVPTRPATARPGPASPQEHAVHSGRNAQPRPPVVPAERVFWRAYRQFNEDLAGLYESPRKARRAILHAAAGSPERVAADIRTSPDRFGTLKTAEGGVREERAAAAAESANLFLQARAERPRPTLKELRDRIAEHGDAVQRARAHPEAVQANGLAKMELRLAEERRGYYFRALEGARESMGRVYADPAAAGRNIWRAVQHKGGAAVARDIRTRPERFGALAAEERRRLFGVWRGQDTSAARANAPDAARAVGIAAEARQQAPSRQQLAQLGARVAGTERDLDAARAAPPSKRSPQQIETELGALMQKAAVQARQVATGTLGPAAAGPQQLLDRTGIKHVQQLAAMVKAPHLAVARAAWDLAAGLARGDQREERGGR